MELKVHGNEEDDTNGGKDGRRDRMGRTMTRDRRGKAETEKDGSERDIF